MTEKRFTVNDGLENVLCWEINDKENEDMTCGECAKLLNELHEENEDLATKKEDAEYELLHLKEMYEELLEEKEKCKKEMLYFKRELQKELVCQAGREKND